MDLKPQLIFENSHINLKLPYATPYLDPQLPSNVPQMALGGCPGYDLGLLRHAFNVWQRQVRQFQACHRGIP